MAGEITSLFLSGPAGPLEALLNAGGEGAGYSALVCHPHPVYGGTMHNKVVYRAAKALNAFGLPVLRFNFRGAGLSAGSHDEGRGEVEDVGAALDWLDRQFRRPIIFAGFSFGAATGLRAACPDKRVVALISLGTPVSLMDRPYGYDFLAACTKPKLFLSGDQDEFGPRPGLEMLVEAASPPRTLALVPGAGHFFDGHLEEVQRVIAEWLPQALPSLRASPNTGQPL